MNQRKELLDRIIKNLTFLASQLEVRGSLNLLDMHLHAEPFVMVLLNKVYGYDLVNLNQMDQNMAAIDLGDFKRGIAVQVTASHTLKKIKDTVKKYQQYDISSDLPHLKVFIFHVKKPKNQSVTIGDYEFDIKNHVISLAELVKTIQSMADMDLLMEIDQWIARETNVVTPYLADEYFNQFIQNPDSASQLLLRSQPTLSDCREVFSDEYFELMHLYYDVRFSAILDPRADWDKFRLFDRYEKISSTYQEVKSGKHNMPGGIGQLVSSNVFRPGKYSFHTVKFSPKDSEYGSSFKVWIKINDRWVFFVRPWEAKNRIDLFKNDKTISKMINLMKSLGFKSDPFEKDYDKEFFLRYFFKQLNS